jgi:hypothetical protein
MSSSDPTSNLDSLDISTEPMDVPAAVGEAASSRCIINTSACLLQKFAGAGRGKAQHVASHQEFAKGSWFW